MKTFRLLLIVTLTCMMIGGTGQTTTLELTFTAVDSTAYVYLDSIKIMNRTQGGDTVLYWPDTVLVLGFPTGIPDFRIEDRGFEVFQNYPNPLTYQATISLYVPEEDRVTLVVSDMLGRAILKTERMLEEGVHSFRFTPGLGNLYFITAWWRGYCNSIKILCAGSGSAGMVTLEYSGSILSPQQFKASAAIQDFAFTPGDTLLFIGYTDTLQSGMLDRPEQSQTYTFQFATNIPCPGTPMVEYEGQVYNTIQIFSQCWLKENLNVGEMIEGTWMEQSNNGTIEKYCYNNEPDSCTKYGGLYQWDEMMHYSTQQGTQGICPPGWHLPTDEEWKVLEGAVDSQYGIGDPEWDIDYIRGYDAGTNLKTTSGWNGTDLFGFSGLPGGGRYYHYGFGFFWNVGGEGNWWTSTENDGYWVWHRDIIYEYPEVLRNDFNYVGAYGFSVRCLRNEFIIPTIELTITAVNNGSNVQLDSIKTMNRTQTDETMINWPDTTLVVPGELRFTPGDELLYIGYADTLQSGILDAPEESQTYTFQFATNIPCPGTPTVMYEGQVYNTIQIFSQCWLKENLNVGMMIQNLQTMTDNDTIEKYCYNNEPDSCTKYGGLYQWSEMMQYTLQPDVRGICPPGWHLPTDEEWKMLEGAVDSQYGIGDSEWDLYWEYRGYDAGTNLKTTSGWYANGNGTDLFGFSGLPGGNRASNGYFYLIGGYGSWWTSTEGLNNTAWGCHIDYCRTEVGRNNNYEGSGYSVRCLRDE